MNALLRRRALFVTATILAGAALIAAWAAARAALRPVDELSGWLLLAAVLFLAGFNLRKKLPFLALGSASTWLQLHVYVGYLALLVFALHLELRWPNGVVETTLAVVFLIVSVSGVAGLWLSRALARRLAGAGDRLLYERIPREREALSRRAEAVALDSIERTDERLIARFHLERLDDYFSGPRHQLGYLLGSASPESHLLESLEVLGRYQEEAGREAIAELVGLVREKAMLDRQLAFQRALRYWLFVHVPATHALLAVLVLHVSLVLGYAS